MVISLIVFETRTLGQRLKQEETFLTVSLAIRRTSIVTRFVSDRNRSSFRANAEKSQRKSLFIGEYALSQTSLEQVFNGFATNQEEERGTAVGLTRARSDYRVGPKTDRAPTTRPIALTGPGRLR